MLRTLSIITVSILFSCGIEKKQEPLALVQSYLVTQGDSLSLALNNLVADARARKPNSTLQNHFRQARAHYKKLEPITELYFAGFSDAINGPAIDESEIYEGKIVEATGFQVVEEYLFTPQGDSIYHAELIREVELLSSMTNRLKQLLSGNALTDEHVYQAIRLQLLRITTLGITGFDSPVALESLPEAKASLEGIKEILSAYSDDNVDEYNDVAQRLDNALNYLVTNNNFDDFDRVVFIKKHLRPISRSIYQFQQVLKIANRRFLSGVNLDKEDFLQRGSYNLEYFTNPNNRSTTEGAVTLGRTLFYDPILSGNNKRACASCHNPAKGFTDGNPKSVAFKFGGAVPRNAPTLLNSAFQRAQFYDSRVMFQEDQVAEVVANPDEMHGDIDKSVGKLVQSEEYRKLFEKAFPGEKISNRSVQKALASYVRSLSSLNSPFDRFMRDEEVTLSSEALNGFNLFMGKAKCATCHFMPFFNGTIPPLFTKSESEVLGVPAKADTINANVDPDLGKFAVYGGELNRFAFKTPTVRNSALTAPYMHNGVYQTLDQVIDFYNRGGGAGIGIVLPNQTLQPDRLDLSTEEQLSLIRFIETLTDTTGMTMRPRTLPEFNDPQLDSRKMGGEY